MFTDDDEPDRDDAYFPIRQKIDLNHDLAGELERLDRLGRRRRLHPRRIDGAYLVTPSGERLLNFGGNDYLGLVAEGNRPEAVVATGGSASSPLVCGWSPDHERLARRIADFESAESALLTASGYAACSGAVAALAGTRDLILSDQLNHASLIDGCRLSAADCKIFRHRDADHVGHLLRQYRDRYRRVWIVTDAIFSMDGTCAPIRRLCDLADRFGGEVMVDEAHATGVIGDHGGGLCQATDTRDRVAVRIGTLSKAIGCQGGFIVGNQAVTDYLVNRCRSLIYSTSLSPAIVAAADRSLDRIIDGSDRRHRLAAMTRKFRRETTLQSDGASHLELGVPIVPVPIGDDSAATQFSRALEQAGFYVPAIRPPTVPEGTARLRVSISAAHTPAMVDRLAVTINRLKRTSSRSG